MNRLINKLTILGTSLLLSASIANASNTICYKDKWNTPSTIELTKLDGGECAGNYSIKEMKENGWRVLDIKIDKNEDSFSYKYLLTNTELKKRENKKVQSNKDTNKLSYQAFGLKIDNIKDNQTIINIGNLIVGQSGVVVHLHDEQKKLIVANATVINSDDTSSVIKFSKFDDLKQNALPTSKRNVEIGDILVLNYLYTSSLLIAPTQESFQIVRDNFKYNSFMHSDVFATYLKTQGKAFPTKESIQNFATKQNLRTIFVVINNKVYVLDTKTFKVLTNYNIKYNASKSQMPFYTRVEKIEDGPLSFDFFDFEEIKSYLKYFEFLLDEEDRTLSNEKENNKESYEKYYKSILGIN